MNAPNEVQGKSIPEKVRAFFKSTKESFTYTPRSLKLAWAASWKAGVTITSLTIVSALLPITVAYVGKLIIDSITNKSLNDTIKWVSAEFVVVAFQSFVQRALFLVRSILGARLGTDVNIMILEKALTLDLKHFEDSKFYDQLTRARREASSRPVSMVTDTLQLLQNALTLVAYGAVLLTFSVWALIGLAVATLPATIAEMRFSNAAFRIRNWRSADTRKLYYLEHVLANDDHAKEVKVFDLGPTLLNRYRTLSENFFKEDAQLNTRRSAWAYVLSLLALAFFYVCYLVMAKDAATGMLTLGTLTFYIVAFRQGQQAFQSCLTAVGSMYEHNLYMSNLFEYLEIPTGKTTHQRTLNQIPASHPGSGIEFENVGFQYPGRSDWALRNINIKIPAGQSLALVGHNGAGKTTFIKLLCGLYEPTEGRILLDGQDIRHWDPETLKQRVSVVFQDFKRYQLTFRENVGVGSVDNLSDSDRVMRAVAQGGSQDVLASLPEGLESSLGTWFHEGVELSGGQWQKIALSRAFMREEADILILDEPTAALDAEAEQAVFERVKSLSRGKTSILISHRFPTVRMADRIVVLEGGHIIEEGNHETLLGAGGRYAKLFALQAQGYL